MSDLASRLRDYANNRGHMAMREAAADEIERLRAALKHIHWSMGDELIHSDVARDNICPLCDDALKQSERD